MTREEIIKEIIEQNEEEFEEFKDFMKSEIYKKLDAIANLLIYTDLITQKQFDEWATSYNEMRIKKMFDEMDEKDLKKFFNS